MQPTQGIHHITAFARDAQVNADFYHKVLGQRMVKRTVNFDSPGTYHTYFGDRVGTPGTIITFFPMADLEDRQEGNGEVAATAYLIPMGSASWWEQRLAAHGITGVERVERFGDTTLCFEDREGMTLELIERDQPATIDFWEEGPIPREHAIRGFHGVTLWVGELEPTAQVLTGELGYERASSEGARHRFLAGGEDRGAIVDVVERPGQPDAQRGAGSVHHVAFRTVHDDEQLEYQEQLRERGHDVTDVRDRNYFHSIYFREPGGVLFEIATDAPGFGVDEEVEEMGRALKLPEWAEPRREEFEAELPPLSYPTLDEDRSPAA